MSAEITAECCPGCGHAMTEHHGRHCAACDTKGVECTALDPAQESPGG